MADAKVDTAELARSLKISYQAVRKVLLGGQFGTENNAAAARRLKVNSDWLATGKGERHARLAPGEAQDNPAATLSAAELQLLEDFQALMDDDQAAFARDIAALAAKMRAHNAKVLQRVTGASTTVERPEPEAPAPDEQYTAADAEHMPRLQHFGLPGATPKTLRKKD